MTTSVEHSPEIAKTIVVNGIATNYHDQGDGAPVVLIHGFVTSAPSQATASAVQDLTALPSMWTTQAPHWLVSQPTWVPVRPRFVRIKSTSSVRFSTFPLTALPFTFMEIAGIQMTSLATPRRH